MKLKLMIILVALSVAFASCSQGQENITTDDNQSYKTIYIDGMTCIQWVSASQRGGLTCNWDEYKSND